MAIGERIRELRGDLPLNQLHQRTKLSAGYLHNVENEGVIPRDENLQAIAEGLGVDAEPLKEERDETLAERKLYEVVDLYLPEGATEEERADAMRALVEHVRALKDAYVNGGADNGDDPPVT